MKACSLPDAVLKLFELVTPQDGGSAASRKGKSTQWQSVWIATVLRKWLNRHKIQCPE